VKASFKLPAAFTLISAADADEDAKATIDITSQTRAVTATTRALDLIIQFIHFGIAGQTHTTVCEALK